MYICCHRAGKAKDLYSRSFLLDEKTSRKDGRVAREKGRIEKEGEGRQSKRQREVVSGELGEDCHESGKRKEKITAGRKGARGERWRTRRGRWTEEGRGAGARLSENGQDK